MTHALRTLAAGMLLTSLWAAGCSDQPRPRPLTASSFAGSRDTGAVRAAPGERTTPAMIMPLNGADQGKILTPDQMRRANPGTASRTPANATGGAAAQANSNGNSAAPNASTPAAAGSRPTVGATSGQFVTVGGVVAEVNGTAIFANKVISMLERDNVIPRMAQQLTAANFRERIEGDIRRQINELVMAELEYAAAQRSLDGDDKKMADAKAINFRMQQITKAGGSVELARRKAREAGYEFEDLIEEYKRYELIRTYYDKRIYPRVQVLAVDIREYYQKNLQKEFSETEKVKFRLLKVDVAKTGSKDVAINKIADKYKRAKGGEDFAEMVLKENDEKMFAIKDPWEMDPKSFSITKVREALVKLQPGQVSEIIEDGPAYYLVKLEERQGGRVHTFEEPKVQNAIRFKLREQQQAKFREEHRMSLLARSVVRPELDVIRGVKPPASDTEREMLNVALEMAMQKYAQYAVNK